MGENGFKVGKRLVKTLISTKNTTSTMFISTAVKIYFLEKNMKGKLDPENCITEQNIDISKT
jgi:hypothetical protein